MVRVLMMALSFLIFFTASAWASAEGVEGFWKTIDEETGRVRSVAAIYEYEGQLYGRLVVINHPDGQITTIDKKETKATKVKGDPYMEGFDFVWGLKKKKNSWSGGNIMDPSNGKIYSSEVWRDKENLIVKGSFLFIGRKQTWQPALDSDFPVGFKKPDFKTFVPVIPDKK